MAQVADPTDERKRLLAALLECPAAVVIDNVESPLRSDALCITLTEPTFTDRLLGASKMATVETNCCFFATGNNLTIAGDLSARALICRIDPEFERPEEREFAVDLHLWVPAHRGELVAASLTIIRAYIAAGSPKTKVTNFASFEEWQRLCRFPLIWLGCADPCELPQADRGVRSVRENLREILAAWHGKFENSAATVKQAIASQDEALRDAMASIAGEKDGINTKNSVGSLQGMSAGSKAGCASKRTAPPAVWPTGARKVGGYVGFRGFLQPPHTKRLFFREWI